MSAPTLLTAAAAAVRRAVAPRCHRPPRAWLRQARVADATRAGGGLRRRTATTWARVPAYEAAHAQSLADPEGFWGEHAKALRWARPYERVLQRPDDSAAGYTWFPGGQLNTCYNAVDVHVEQGRGDQPALIFDSAVTGEVASYTYAELRDRVAATAGALRALGVGHGDRVVIYMPMVAEAAVAMLACARLGAIHSVVFGGFASHELAVRIDDAAPKVVVSASCGLEGADRVLEYKPLLDAALDMAEHKPEACLILQRPQVAASMVTGRDVDWHQAVAAAEPAPPVPVDATHPCYILYTSGTTGLPKGVVRDTAGHMVALKYSMGAVYDMQAGDVWWAASDVGWVVGHSYIVYAPLLAGCTTILFEGKPVGTPDAGTFWRTIRRHGVKAMFTAPTAFRAIRKEDPQGRFLREEGGVGPAFETLFLAGERSDPETVQWAQEQLKVPVVDHYWQTESGWPIIANCKGYGLHATKLGSSTKAVPGWDMHVLHPRYTPGDEDGDSLAPGQEPEYAGPNELGPLVARLPLPPGALPTLWNDVARFKRSYLDPFPGFYHSGDAATIDEHGYIDIMSRTDDILNVAGHRLSTGALEAAIATHPDVAEVAVIGPADQLKGQVPVALVVPKDGRTTPDDELVAGVIAAVRREVGAVASFKQAAIVARLPKTRSGKTLRGTMKAIADGTKYKVPATIDDPVTLVEVEAALQTLGYALAR